MSPTAAIPVISDWRTAQDKINRFYFTDVPDSYAAVVGMDIHITGFGTMMVMPLRHPAGDKCHGRDTWKAGPGMVLPSMTYLTASPC